MKKTKGNAKTLSRNFIIIWGVLLVITVMLLFWATVSNMQNTEGVEIAPPIELELPSPMPQDKHIIEQDKKQVEGDSAEASPEIQLGDSQRALAENALMESSEHGFIPKQGLEHKEIIEHYAAVANPEIEDKLKVVFIFSCLGRNHSNLERILEETPPEVTMAFLPYGDNMQEAINLARAKGHEVLLSAAMEPTDYPDSDPGPHTLLTGLPAEKNLDRLHWALSRGSEYIGIMNIQGSLFLSSHQDLKPVLEDIKNRGLAFVEAISTFRSEADEIAAEINIPYLRSQFVLSETLTPKELHATLIRAEQMADKTNYLVIVAPASPRTLPILIKWIQNAQQQNYAFIPVSQALQIAESHTLTGTESAQKVKS